ncbi:MAG TPA: class I SAM-dependent methyltransferase [Candidatus Binataceae bacterium]|nr:class I SAM-dependent methyltransferase [Candidatus Binataceae bacterium]
MRFEEFIARCHREWPEFGDQRRLARAIHPADRTLANILTEIPAMATENKLKLLNCAAAALDPGEVYVEVGCYKGASIVGAATGNPGSRIFACDNFSQFDGAAEALRSTLEARTALGQVTFHDADFREFFQSAPWRPAKIGAYFYDGGHSFSDQYDGVALAIPYLAADAIVIVDDTNKREARAADAMIARAVPGFEQILDLRTPGNHSPTWWNGIQVFRYRGGRAANATATRGFGYAVRKLIYDDILLAMKHRRRALRKEIKARIRSKRS